MHSIPARPKVRCAAGALFALLPVLLQPGPLLAQLSPTHVADLVQVTSVRMSPDAEQVAYTISQPRAEAEPPGRGYSELWLVPASGGEPRPIVRRPASASAPAWSPDGRTLAFVARFEQHHAQPQVYGVTRDGGEPRPLTRSPMGVMAFAFSPDGRSIAYTAREPESEERAAQRARGYDMIVSGEAEWHVRLWVEPAGGGQAVAVTPTDVTVRDFAWSPDGQRFAVQLTDGTGADDNEMFRRLYTVPASGGAPRLLARTEGKLGGMAWSPDGARLAFIGAIAFNDPLAQSVFVVPAAGGTPANRTPAYEGTAEWVGWQDDRTLLFVAVEGTRTALNRVGADGGAIERVRGGGQEVFRTISMDARRQNFAAPVNTRTHPNEVYAGGLGPGELRRLTRHNPFLDGLRTARQETIEWTSYDGLRIEGVLVRPLDEQPGRRYPLAILPHGGPEGISIDGWNTRALYPAHVLASRGYVVLKPNYRGSGGRGPAFAMANHRDLGGKEFEDVLAGIDHLVEQGLVDPDRVGMSGTSYGGYFSAWAGTRHSDRFAAAITFAGLSNWISFTGTTDIPHEMSVVHWDLYWFDNPGLNWDRSPVAHLDRASTPILVAHGLVDERVHPEQSLQLYQFLKLRGVPTGLVLYPREPHGLLERAHQLDFMNRVIEWFDRYLTGDRPATN